MANPRCGACDDLRDTSGDFIVNGVTESICESLHDNTGLNPTLLVLHTDEEDLHSINDCLVGRKPMRYQHTMFATGRNTLQSLFRTFMKHCGQ